MKALKLGRLEFRIMDVFWKRGACSVREVQEAFPETDRPAYTTVQTTVYRLEAKKALRVVKTIGKAKIFDAEIRRDHTQIGLIDQFLGLFGNDLMPVAARLVDSGKLSQNDIKDMQRMLRAHRRKDTSK